jgi:putative Mn2+ efflux pump MntP
MDTISIILIAIGLSMDSFAVSVTNGLTITNLTIRKILTISFSLALFQGLMPLLGWYAGMGIEKYIQEIDHWVAFILLGIIGIKMIYEGLNKSENAKVSEINPITLLAQSLSTSIDAFVVGISFALLGWPIIKPVVIIGSATLVFSLIGLQVGKYLGRSVGKSAAIIGGIVLIGIGTKILIEHLYFQ